MAIYYKWIKGCAPGASIDKGLWTYLKWGSGTDGATTANTSISNLPHIYTYIGKQDNPEKENDLGYILTNNATGVNITTTWNFEQGIKFGKEDQTTFKIFSFGKPDLLGDVDFDGGSYVFKSNLKCGNLNVGDTIGTKALNAQTIAVTESCSAKYFNATSDMRAKYDINTFNFSALELIKKLPVYIFKYKNGDGSAIPGIMAQDLLREQGCSLDLINNKEASGENGDYMSIKESKLVYILMEAIKEQQIKIEELEYKLKRFENK